MRVVVVNQHLEEVTGGSELQCDLVARGLAARGHDVVYLALGGRGGPRSVGPYRRESVEARPGAILAACRQLDPDVVYWRFGRTHLRHVARGLRRDGTPLVLAVAHVDDVRRFPRIPRPSSRTPRAVAAWLRAMLSAARSFSGLRAVRAVASQRADLLSVAPVALQRVVPNLLGPELRARLAGSPAGADVDAADRARPYVAWVGNLKARKRPDLCPVLADALAPLGVDLIMAGGLQDPDLAWLTEPDPTRPNLHYVGLLERAEVIRLLAGARCTAITYRPEGFSNVILQSWAVGTPTVSLDYDPDGLIRSEGLGGFADGDRARFVRQVAAMASDRSARERASTAARSTIDTRFDDSRSLDALERLLSEVSGGPRDVVSRR